MTLDELRSFILEPLYRHHSSQIQEMFIQTFREDWEKFFYGNKKPNDTVLWIKDQGPDLLLILKRHLTKRMPRSSQLGKIEDHVSKFIEDIIRRDAIGKRNRKGKKTYLSQVKSWAVRNAHTQNRDAGVDALFRCMHGALTRKEWTHVKYDNVDKWTEIVLPKNLKQAEQVDITLLKSSDTPGYVIESESSMNRLSELIKKILQKNIRDPENLDYYMKVTFMFFLESYKVAEIAETLSLEEKRVSAMITKIKKVLRREKKVLSLSI